MGPLKRLIGSLLFFVYRGGREGARRRKALKGSQSLPKASRRLPNGSQSLLRRARTLFQRSFLHYLPTRCLKSSVFVRDILKIKMKKKSRGIPLCKAFFAKDKQRSVSKLSEGFGRLGEDIGRLGRCFRRLWGGFGKPYHRKT